MNYVQIVGWSVQLDNGERFPAYIHVNQDMFYFRPGKMEHFTGVGMRLVLDAHAIGR